MKKKLFFLLLTVILGFATDGFTQSYEISRLILDIEKLSQLKYMLSDLYKGYETLKTGYATIKDISEGNFNLHKAFLDGLLAVSPAVQKYERIVNILDLQTKIIEETKTSLNRYRQNTHFNADELEYIGQVYVSLDDKSATNLENLLRVLTAGSLRMSDAERLAEIDRIYFDTRDQFLFLRKFNNGADLLTLNRSNQDNEVLTLWNFYGIK
jgi:hypothetical protein